MEFNYDQLSNEWDAIAEERYWDLKEGRDVSYANILKPAVLHELSQLNLENVLDVGCGVGVLTEEIAKTSKHVTAVDVSAKSIEIAKRYSTNRNVNYVNANITDLISSGDFTTVISNMTLMTVPDLEKVLRSIARIMKKESTLLFTITHPAFWPIYWNYARDSFRYNEEVSIVSSFKTRSKNYNLKTHHFHRPLSDYFNMLSKANYKIVNTRELRGFEEDFWYPRFLLIRAELHEPNTTH